jgi:rfaE bifunctional protein kinase chain/domain
MTAREILAAIPRLSALVVGDICLDRWCTYEPGAAEPSRETGIPRIGVVATEVTAGAGGTVANNLCALGVKRVAVLGIIGDDGFGAELERALAARGASGEFLVKDPRVQTFTYTKLLNARTGVEDLPRVDWINTRPMPKVAERQVLEKLRAAADSFDAVIVSDQAETEQGGVVTASVRGWLSELGRRDPRKVIVADSRKRVERFRNVILKPNRQEADTACRTLFGAVDYRRLKDETRAPLLMVTHGGDGVLILDGTGEAWVKTRRVENPVDICGAGDSFSAGAALALAAGATAADAARFGNLAASVTIMKKGTGTASPEEVLAAEAASAQ